MTIYETVAVPFKTVGNQQVLTEHQLAESAYLAEFVQAFPACFEHDHVRQVMVFYPNGDAPA